MTINNIITCLNRPLKLEFVIIFMDSIVIVNGCFDDTKVQH
jgi:hypothetical protein